MTVANIIFNILVSGDIIYWGIKCLQPLKSGVRWKCDLCTALKELRPLRWCTRSDAWETPVSSSSSVHIDHICQLLINWSCLSMNPILFFWSLLGRVGAHWYWLMCLNTLMLFTLLFWHKYMSPVFGMHSGQIRQYVMSISVLISHFGSFCLFACFWFPTYKCETQIKILFLNHTQNLLCIASACSAQVCMKWAFMAWPCMTCTTWACTARLCLELASIKHNLLSEVSNLHFWLPTFSKQV